MNESIEPEFAFGFGDAHYKKVVFRGWHYSGIVGVEE